MNRARRRPTAGPSPEDAPRETWQLAVEHTLTTAVLETVDIAIVACDADGHLTLFNQTARRFHGVPVDETISPTQWAQAYGLFAEDGVTPLSREQVPLWRALQDGAVTDRIIVIAPAGMAPRTVRCDGRQLLGEDGLVVGAVVAMHDISDLRAAEVELRDERDLALSVVNTTSDCYLAVDGAGLVTHWNPAAEQLFGYTEAEAVGSHVVDLVVSSAARAECAPRFEKCFVAVAEGQDLTGIRLHRKDGTPIECDMTAWTSGVGRDRRAHAFIRDRTAQRRTTEALVAAHDELTRVLDAMPRSITLATVVRDADGDPVDLRVAWLNAHGQSLVDMPIERVQGRSIRELWPRLAEAYLDTYLDVARQGESRWLPVDWFDGDRVHGAFEVTLTSLDRDSLLIDVLDVTETRSAERALRWSEERAREAQERAGLAGWDLNLTTGEMRWSPLMFEIFGIDPGTMPSHALMEGLLHPEDHDAVLEALAGAIRDPEAIAADFRVVRTDGRIAYIHCTAVADRDAAGNPIKLWGTNQDVTDVVCREEELAAAAERDPLTGLFNRRGWEAHSVRAVHRHAAGESAVVVMLDLDHFKKLNDTQGHAVGDQLLRECALRWQRRLRIGDLLARVGGEEFALLLFGCDQGAAEQLVDDLRAETPLPVTASAGLAVLHLGESVEDGLRRADAALYVAKESGRNVTILALPQQREPSTGVEVSRRR